MFKLCPKCGEETLFITEPVYEGFKKVAETCICSVCGEKGDVSIKASSPKTDPLADLFGDDAEPEKISLFDVEAETAKLCRKCMHYVLHPFTQRCGLHDKEVLATDSCPDFVTKET